MINLKYDRDYYTDRNTLDRFLAQDSRDDLEEAFIETELRKATAKVNEVIGKFSSRPEFARRLAARLAEKELGRDY
jgi:hypothetical protein